MKTIRAITTVGTSMFTNYMDSKVEDSFECNNEEHESISDLFEELDSMNYEQYDDETNCINRMKNILNNYWIKGISKCEGEWEFKTDEYNFDASAEIKSLNLIQQKYKESNLIVELICTDTILSKVSAELIKENINKMNSNITVKDIHVIKGLQIDNYQDFKKIGLQNLYSKLDKLVSIDKEKIDKNDEYELIKNSSDVILNASGGYKALIPYISIYGQLYSIPLYYIYENSDELIIIDKLPVEFDWFFAEENYPFISEPDLYQNNTKKIKELRKLNIIEERGTKLTAVGELYKKYIEENMPISKNIMGYFMEYKVYEYLINNPYKDYKIVKHSVRKDDSPENKWIGEREFDLVLFKKEYNYSDFIVGEVKSYYQIYRKDSYKEYIKQLNGQLEKFIKSNNISKEYHLYVYITKSKTPNNQFKENLKEIESIIKQKCSCEFKVSLINLNYEVKVEVPFNESLRNINANPYTWIMSSPLSEEDIQKNYKFD